MSKLRRPDPRYYQITVLTLLLVYGIFGLDFEVTAGRTLAILGAALGAQYVCGRLAGLPSFDPKSALISGLSLCLLLRTASLPLAALTAASSIASKFGLRFAGKHVFNPTNFGLAAMMLVTGSVWVSPGQWGSLAWFGFLMASLGGLVVYRSSRSDVTLAFIGFYGAVLFGRALFLGQPLTIPWHQLQSGAFLLFSFFMISDPKTTPDSRRGRILFALLVALGTGAVHFVLYRPSGLIWSLFFLSPAVPLIDRILPGERYQWERTHPPTSLPRKGASHEKVFARVAGSPGTGRLLVHQ